MVMPSRRAASAIFEVSSRTAASSTLSGRRITDCMKPALLPLVATSLALTTTACHPAFFATPVTGSEETMRNPLRSFTTPKSSPTLGDRTSSFDFAPVILKTYFRRSSGGSFPSASFKLSWLGEGEGLGVCGRRRRLSDRGAATVGDDSLDAPDEGDRYDQAYHSLRDVKGNLRRRSRLAEHKRLVEEVAQHHLRTPEEDRER